MVSPHVEQRKSSEALAATVLNGFAIWGLTAGLSGGFIPLLKALPQAGLFGAFGVGIHSAVGLKKEDYDGVPGLAWECLTAGAKTSGLQLLAAPVVDAINTLPGIEETSSEEFDPGEMLTHSAMIVAPPGTGKSFLLSLLMCERQRRTPNAPFYICSRNNWKRDQNWMGLRFCPEWLQQKYLGFGYKYLHESEISEAAHRETDDAVDRMFELMMERSRSILNAQGEDGVDLSMALLVIDEFPSYWRWLERNKDGDRQSKIKELLREGHGYHTLLWVVSQDDAVNMIGLRESDKRTLMTVRPFAPGPFESIDSGLAKSIIEYVNQRNDRRVLYMYNGMMALQPVPECEKEPVMDWSKAIAFGEFLEWLHSVSELVAGLKGNGASMSQVWGELVQRTDFPEAANKRQGADNANYTQFKNFYEGLDA